MRTDLPREKPARLEDCGAMAFGTPAALA